MVCRLMWNSCSHQLVGLAMSHDELASVTNVYQLLDPATYILQFLWNHPYIVGPYFMSSGPLESKFCVFESTCTDSRHVLMQLSRLQLKGAYGNTEVNLNRCIGLFVPAK